MWRTISKILLWLQVLGGFILSGAISYIVYTMMQFNNADEDMTFVVCLIILLVGIVITLVLMSFLGMIVEMAGNVAKIAKNTRYINQNIEESPIVVQQVQAAQPQQKEPTPKMKSPVKEKKISQTWYCEKCGKENSFKNQFCINCGEKRN